MSFTSFNEFNEVFLFGNLSLVEDTDIKKLNDFYDKIDIEMKENTQWCIFNNLKYILNNIDNYVDDENLFINFIKFANKCLLQMRKLLQIKTIDLEDETNYGIIHYILVDTCIKKTDLLCSTKSDTVRKIFNSDTLLSENNVYMEYNIPYGRWTSKYIFIVNDKKKYIHEIDIYIDNMFVNTDFKYSSSCCKFIKLLADRLTVVNSLPYYKKYINSKLKTVSKNIYENYPLNYIYKYYKLLLHIDNIYIPDIYKKLDDSDDSWLFSILPDTIRCYLLGITVISNGSISKDLQISKIKDYINNKKAYYTKLSSKNKQYIELMTDSLSCGNGIDEEGFPYDVLYNNIFTYNLDDILIVFSHSTYHLFTCSEYEQLLKKKTNPYNRDKLTSHLGKITNNIEWKNKNIIKLNKRYINIKFNLNLEDNLEELKNKLEDSDIKSIQPNNLKMMLNLMPNINIMI